MPQPHHSSRTDAGEAANAKPRTPKPDWAAKHLAAVERSLGWADDAAERGDYADALGWLMAVEASGDDLPQPVHRKREHWTQALVSQRGAGL